MPLMPNFLAIIALLLAFTIGVAPTAARAEQRIALVLGNAAYEAGALQTTANDAGLIAQTLEAAGFEVIGARDLDHDALRDAFRDFIGKAAQLGPEGVAVVYLGGYGLQLEGENYFVPIDARIERAADVPVQAVRISDYTRALSALKLKVSVAILDLARTHPFALKGEPLAGGLALVTPEADMLIAFNAAPDTIAPAAAGAYGPYAKALAEMMREGGLGLDAMFERVRLRVSDATQGAQVPWHASNIAAPFVFFERTPDAPSLAASEPSPASRSRPIRELGAQEAYIAALERDTLQDYLQFLDAYGTDPLARRVWAIVAARREALTWRQTRWLDTPAAYWSYLRLYPEGPHAADCGRRLGYLHASLEAPPEFNAVDYDIPPPSPPESLYLQQPEILLADPAYDLAPPPPIPTAFLQPQPPELLDLPPPELPQEPFVLPTPVYTPVPVWVRPPHEVEPPPANNVIFANVHNKIVIDRTAQTFTLTERGGHPRTLPAPAALQDRDRRRPERHADPGGGLPAKLGPALPPSLARLPQRPNRENRLGLPIPGATKPVQPGTPAGSITANRQLSLPRTPQAGQPMPQGAPQTPAAAVPRQGPAQPTQALPKVVLPSRAQAVPTGQPQQIERQRAQQQQQEQQQLQQRAQQEQAAAAARQQQQAAQAARQAEAAAARQHQLTQPGAVPRIQQQAGGAAAAASLHQQAAQSAAAARAQQQAVQAAAAARAQQQAAQAAAAARGQQQAVQAAAAARAQQQAAQAAQAARAQQQAAQAAQAARAQQQAAQAAQAARAQQQAAQAAQAARAQQQAAQAAAAARAQQQAAQAAQAAAAARASAAVAAARAQAHH